MNLITELKRLLEITQTNREGKRNMRKASTSKTLSRLSARRRTGREHEVPPRRHRDGRVLPEGIKLGFNNDDIIHEYERLPPGKPFPAGQKFLQEGQRPSLGQYVKVHVLLTRKMRDDLGELTNWFAVGGRVVHVVDENTVVALVSPTTLNTPLLYEGDWHVVLRFDPDYRFPWVLRWMGRAAR